MPAEPFLVTLGPDSPLARALEAAAASGARVVVEANGRRYSVAPEAKEDLWADYDPAEALAALNEAAGSWSDIDPDELNAMLYRARQLGSRLEPNV